MAFAFDTLGYAKKLRDAGIPQQQAESHAEAAREFIMAELATRYDLDATRRELESAITETRRDLDATRHDLEGAIASVQHDLEGAIERAALRTTIRTGVMLAAGLSLLAAVLKLH